MVLLVGGIGSAAIVTRQVADDVIPDGWKSHKPLFLGVLVAVAFACQWAGAYLANRRPPIVRKLLHCLWADALGKSPRCRVTLMTVKKPAWWREPYFFFKREKQPTKEWAEATSVRHPPGGERTRVRFHPGEGVVGLAWIAGARVDHQAAPSFKDHNGTYLEYCQKHIGIPPEKALGLGKKCQSYVCAPIFDGSDSSNIRGFVSVDSEGPEAFVRGKVDEIETFAKMLGPVMYGSGGGS